MQAIYNHREMVKQDKYKYRRKVRTSTNNQIIVGTLRTVYYTSKLAYE